MSKVTNYKNSIMIPEDYDAKDIQLESRPKQN